MNRILIGAAVLFLFIISGLLAWFGDISSATSPNVGGAGGRPASMERYIESEEPLRFTTGLESLPSSLRGTEVDGEFEIDANGHLKITNGIRRTFDYFLTAVGEESVDTVVARIRAYIRNKLKDPAASEAEHILEGYISYKNGLKALQDQQKALRPELSMRESAVNLDMVRNQIEQVKILRAQYLSSEVIQAFFGDDDAYDRYTMERLQVLGNSDLSAAQRAGQLKSLEQQLPISIRESMLTINRYQNLKDMTSECKRRNCSPGELRQIRDNLVGAEAADRLERLDQEDVAWEQRMNSWYKRRDDIEKNQNIGDQDKKYQLEQERKLLFSDSERIRVEALEHIHDELPRLP